MRASRIPALLPDASDFREGQESLKTVVRHIDESAFSGWTIQWGLESTTDSDTKDMSRFYDDLFAFDSAAMRSLRENSSSAFALATYPQDLNTPKNGSPIMLPATEVGIE